MVPKHSDQMTTVKKQREIVIEYERIQLIRKRARTELANCLECGGDTDFVTLTSAAELFDRTEDEIFQFIQQNRCHYRADDADKIQLCLTSLLA